MKNFFKTRFLKIGLAFETTSSVKLSITTVLIALYIFARVYYGYSVYHTFDEIQVGLQHLFGLKHNVINFTIVSELFVGFLEAKPQTFSNSVVNKMYQVSKMLPLWVLYTYVLIFGILLVFYQIGGLIEIAEVFAKEIGLHYLVHFLGKDRKCAFFKCRRLMVKLKSILKNSL